MSFIEKVLYFLGFVTRYRYQILKNRAEKFQTENHYYYSENQRLYKLLAPCKCKKG